MMSAALFFFPLRRATWALAALVLLGAGGCSGSSVAEKPLDERYGHRYADGASGSERTLAITPPDSAASYFYYAAPIRAVTVRRAEEAGPTALELLLEGALPNACLALHEAEQARSGHLVRVTLQMRRPRDVQCPSMVRPYRFYMPLEGRFAPGSYTLFVNGEAYPLTIRERS